MPPCESGRSDFTAKQAKGIVVELDGNTTNLTKSVNEANKAGASLGKELQQVNRLLKLDPGNVVLVKQKQDLLSQSIATTKGKLSEMEAAQKQVEAQFKSGEIDGGQYRNFQRELEKTKSNLAALEKEKKSVSGLGGAFEQVKIKIGEAKEKLEPLVGGLQKLGSLTAAGVEVGKKALTAYATAAVGAGTAVAAMTTSAAAWSDDVNTIAAQTGLSTEQIQKFQYATEVIDVPLETLTGSMAKLTRNMGMAQKGTGNASDAFKALGVSIKDNATGELRNNQDVFNDTIAALSDMENETQRDAYAMQIFGRSAQDLNPLIKGGADALKELGDSAESAGLILSQDALDGLNDYNDSVDILKSNASAAGKVFAGVFAGGLQTVTDTIGAQLPQITSALTGLFSGGDPAAAQASLTTSFTTIITGALDTLGDYLPKFLMAFNTVILSIVNSLSATLPKYINTLLPQLISGLVGLVDGLVAQIPVLLPLIVQAALTLFIGLLDGLNQIVPQLVEMIPQLISDISAMLVENLPLIIQGGVQLMLSLMQGIVVAIPELITSITDLIPVITTTLLDNLPLIIAAGLEITVAVAKGLIQAIPQLAASIPQIITSIVNALTEGISKITEVGANIVKGLWQGIKDTAQWLWDMIEGFCQDMLDGILGFFGIKSPSTLMRDKVGRHLAEGIGVGFVSTMKKVRADMQQAIPADFNTRIQLADDPQKPKPGQGGGAAGAVFNQTNHYHSPKAITAAEAARKTRNDTKQLLLQGGYA